MSQNVYQFIDLQRVDPPKKPLKIRKIEFVEIYEPFSEGQAKAQADRCLSCGNLCGKCHPFYTGKQRDVATGGRVDRFNKRFSVPGTSK